MNLNKTIVALICFLGFIATSLFAPFLYFTNMFGDNIASAGGVSYKDNSKIFSNLNIRALSYAIYDSSNNEFVYSKNGNAQLPLASIAKVMSGVSAIRIAERMDNDRSVKFAGKWWNLYDLMKFSLVSSSNEGVTSIAEAMSTIENNGNHKVQTFDFVDEMNSIAKELGLKTTYFLNETGLDINENLGGGVYLSGAYGSSKDVSKMFAYAIQKYPIVFGSTKYPDIKIISNDGEEKFSKNTNLDTVKMTTLIASKTGTTDLAGGNLVIAFDAGLSHPIIISILGSTPEDRSNDAEKLIKSTINFLSNSK